MYIPEEKDSQVRMIFNKLRDEKTSRQLYELICGWLVSKDSEEEKEREMASLFNETFTYAKRPSRRAYRSYTNFMSKIKWLAVRQVKTPLYRRPAFKVAAALVPLLLLAGGVYLTVSVSSIEKNSASMVAMTYESVMPEVVELTAVVAGAGEKHSVVLPDNSMVKLSEGSEIRHSVSPEGKRYVELEGEALFIVSEAVDEDNSFVVNTDHLNIVVLGTQFKVNAPTGADFSTIDLYHGSISVTAGDQQTVMTPGQHMHYTYSTQQMRITDTPIGARSYDSMPGLVFDGSSLAEIFETIEELYGVQLNYRASSAANENIVADFTASQSIDQLMKALSMVSENFTYRITNDEVIVTMK